MTRRTLFLAVAVLALAGCSTKPTDNPAPPPSGPTAGTGTQTRLDFDGGTALPNGAQVFTGAWAIRAEPGTPSAPNALCQTGNTEFPAIALTTDNYRDLVASVRFKAISGSKDQAAGIIFRIQDKDNYYILRANALENNVNFYQYTAGNRADLSQGSATVSAGQWHELRVEVTGTAMTGYLDGDKAATATNAAFAAGRAGLWTKADSTTCFDDFAVTAR